MRQTMDQTSSLLLTLRHPVYGRTAPWHTETEVNELSRSHNNAAARRAESRQTSRSITGPDTIRQQRARLDYCYSILRAQALIMSRDIHFLAEPARW